jgi:heterotetrameric sarcosine oxidase gamma subunit
VSEKVEPRWRRAGAWDGLARPGRYGRENGPAGIRIVPREGLGLFTLIARAGSGTEFAGVARAHLGLTPPDRPKAVFAANTCLVWSGVDQWLLVSDGPVLLPALAEAVGNLVALADQSDARAVLRLSGPQVRDVLAKGCLIDLHSRAFGVGDAALTAIGHIGVQIWQIDDAPTYDLAIFRSQAASFWTWLAASSAICGYEVAEGPGMRRERQSTDALPLP